MEITRRPLVSIGVPVFNGEAGLARCLDALLQQDYDNLEIIVSDNASTDATVAIGEHYARLDRRVKFLRSDRNRGGIWNFNRVFELSSGEYFMWAAHDDDRASSFVSACVARMEACRDAVLCQTHTVGLIEGNDEPFYVARLDSFEHVTGVVERYRETLWRVPATAVYGLYRSSAMRATRVFAYTIAPEIAFIRELSIYGRFVQVPETLFRYSMRPTWNTIQRDAQASIGRRKPWWYLPFVVVFVDSSRRLMHAPVPVSMRMRLWLVLARYEAGQTVLKTVRMLAGALCPGRWKERLGHAFCRRWLHNPNVEILNPELFFERVCKPRLGWW